MRPDIDTEIPTVNRYLGFIQNAEYGEFSECHMAPSRACSYRK